MEREHEDDGIEIGSWVLDIYDGAFGKKTY
jgi:hypothetical protein